MTTSKRWCLLALPALLAGCLEVDQHPAWIKGKYAGKRDQQPYEQYFHHDRLSWWASLSNRALRQNEYNRAKPPERPLAASAMPPGAQPPALVAQPALQRAQTQREQVRQTYSQQVQQGQPPQAPQPQARGSRAGPAAQPGAQPPRQRQPGKGG